MTFRQPGISGNFIAGLLLLACLDTSPTMADANPASRFAGLINPLLGLILEEKPEFFVWTSCTELREPDTQNGCSVFIESTSTMYRDITLHLEYSGTAQLNADFVAPATVTVERGKNLAELKIQPVNDGIGEGTKTIVVNLSLNEQYLPHYGLIPGGSTKTINLVDVPTLTIAFNQPSFQEGGDGASFTITRSGDDLGTELDVSLAYTGSADALDYHINGASVLYPGESRAEVFLLAVEDNLIEGDEDITVSINANPAYQVGDPGSDSILLWDTEPHVCEDSSIPYTHSVNACARFWGCSSAVFFAKDETICYSWGYRLVEPGTLKTFSCEERHFNCELTETVPLSDRVDREDGSYTIYWDAGATWMNFSPLE
ncbi:MAG: hypothetical protein KDI88_07335 [Gammaproteobacteria bacterium]|nr:hypothetical protein [Gammaproteobacteria bacterium]